MPREPKQSKKITREEARHLFLKYVTSLVDYWDKESRAEDSRSKLEGFLHSLLVTLDGGALALPGYLLVPSTAEGDKDFAEEQGFDYHPHFDEDDLGESYDIGGGLHEEMYAYLRGEVERPENLYDFEQYMADEAKKFGHR